ncbi:hypothetical protein [Nocardiopsis composta]|uniref:(d)CMP kinase n=1 Tax=Nocardiopsis composta TaxID=157465 RepID=A0A7W8VCT4_9ACTN|nr:hypothetical protein [Nocardiopsis composta]MBB5431741.1 hypothetical protein [Nocardiopsis composta]
MPVVPTDSPDWRSRVADLLLRAPARAGRCRVLALEGPSGSGKTSLAGALAERLRCPVVHMDDLYPGWEGLAASVTRARREVLEPIAEGRPPRWRRWDWEAGDWAPDGPGGRHRVDPAGALVIEGCGAGGAELRPLLSLLAWVEVPEQVRAERLDARSDSALYAPYRSMWAAQEARFYASDAPRDHADLVLENG